MLGKACSDPLTSNVNKRPVDTLVRRARVAQTGACIETNRVVGCGSHVLEIDALFCWRISLWAGQTPRQSLRGDGDRSTAIRPSVLTSHFWPSAVSEHSASAMGAMSFQALLAPASMQSVVSTSWIRVLPFCSHHCWSGLLVSVCTTRVLPALTGVLGTTTNLVLTLDVMYTLRYPAGGVAWAKPVAAKARTRSGVANMVLDQGE